MPGIFGWSYPPGCSGPPEDDGPCGVCGASVDDCDCPECPTCSGVGDPKCYTEHGLSLDRKRLAAALVRWEIIRRQNVADDLYWAEMAERGTAEPEY
jgi:hypothetical protein